MKTKLLALSALALFCFGLSSSLYSYEEVPTRDYEEETTEHRRTNYPEQRPEEYAPVDDYDDYEDYDRATEDSFERTREHTPEGHQEYEYEDEVQEPYLDHEADVYEDQQDY